MASVSRRTADLVRRVRGEYLEMPGLRLSAQQAQRLFGLSAAECDLVLAALLQSGFLSRARNGMFATTQPTGRRANTVELGTSQH